MEENPEIIQKFTNALQKGMDYVQIHTPEEIAEVIAPQFKETDIETITTIVKRYYDQDTWKENLIFEKDSFELLQDILEDAGELSQRVNYEELVQTSSAEKASKDKSKSTQEVIEPSNIAGVKIENDGTSVKIENSQLDLTTILENYSYLGSNCLDLSSFIEDYKTDEKSQYKESENEIIMETKNKILHINKETHNPTQMEIKDNKQKTTIYILYNEVKVNSTQ